MSDLTPCPRWDVWREIWRAHAKTSLFRRRFDRAVEIAEGAQRRVASDGVFASNSGGKDSLAMLAVIYEAGLDPVCVHADSVLHTPGMREAAVAGAEAFGFAWEVIAPDVDEWTLLRTIDASVPIWEERAHVQLRNRTSSGSMLIGYMRQTKRLGALIGMRAEESRGRKMNRRVRGADYRVRADDTWVITPIVDWSGRDVWAALELYELEPPAHYRLLAERFGISPESPASRVDCVLTGIEPASRGAWATARVLYPDLWSRIRAARPEVEALCGG